MPCDFAETADGLVLIANGIDPVQRWTGGSEPTEPAGIVAPTLTPTLVQTGTDGPIAGKYRAFLRYVTADGSVSNLSPVSPEITALGATGFTYGNLDIPVTQRVILRQLLRNTDGQYRVFYVDVETDDLSSASLTGSKTDAELAASEAVAILDANGRVASDRYGPPPAHKPFLAYHIDCMWLAGEQAFAEGSIAVTQYGTTVTGYGTRWPKSFVGRFLYASGSSQSYEILAVDVENQTLTLLDEYLGSTDPYAEYAIRPPPAESSLVYFSEAGLPEAWPATNALALPQDGDIVTGLMPYRSFLYILKRRTMYRLTAQSDPLLDGFMFRVGGRGCVNNRCWVVIESAAYMMDDGGIYKFSGDDTEAISTPIQNLFRRDNPGAICWAASRYFHAAHDLSGETIRWLVSLRGEYLPRHALCFAYKMNRWWIEEFPLPIGASAVGRSGRITGGWGDDGRAVYLGGPAGAIYALGRSALDTFASDVGYTTSGTTTSAGGDTLTDLAASFDTTWANVPVAITSGRGAGQLRIIVSATSTVLRVNETWSTKPDGTSKYQVGGIRYHYRGARLRYAGAEARDGRSAELCFEPTVAPSECRLRVIEDFSTTALRAGRDIGLGQRPFGVSAKKAAFETRIDLSAKNGIQWVRFDGHRELSTDGPRLVAVELEGCTGAERVRFGEMLLNGLVR